MKKARLVCLVCSLGLFLPWPVLAKNTVNSSWLAGGPGVWEFGGNWTDGLVPSNNSTNDFNVSIGDVAPVDGVTLRTEAGIFHLAVESQSKLYLTNNSELEIYNFPDAMTGYPEQELAIGGDIVFENSSDGVAYLQLDEGDMTLTGFGGVGGTLWLTNSGSTIKGYTSDANYDTRLLMTGGTTIRGAGQITDMALKLDPQCAIFAEKGGTLHWTANTDYFSSTNKGMLQAYDTGSVFILDGQTSLYHYHVLNNAGGLIAGINGGTVELQNDIAIIGGDLQTVGTGRVRGGGVLEDITLDDSSFFDVINGTAWIDAINNEGVFTVIGNAGIYIESPGVTLTGGGSVLLSTNDGDADLISSIYLANGSLRNVNNLIHGQGFIQDISQTNLFVLDNEGRIEADTPGSPYVGYLWLFPNDNYFYTWTNSGTLSATNGGFLWVGYGTKFSLDNSNGLIVANSNSTVLLEGEEIYNGTISANGSNAVVLVDGLELNKLLMTTTNGGLVAVAGYNGSYHSTIDQVLNLGDIVVSNGWTLYLGGDVTNEGRIFIDPSATNSTYISLNTDLTVSGGGSIELNNANYSQLTSVSGTSRLVNNGNIIRGTGTILGVLLVNQGIVQADAATPLTLFPPFVGWTNNGTLRATGTGGFVFVDPLLVNLGTIQVSAGSSFGSFLNSVIRQDAGEITVDGAVSNQFSSGSVVINAGTLRGSGVIVGNVTNSGGILSPGDSPGKLTITGYFTQQTNGTFNIEIGGTMPGITYDQLVVGTNANLSGTLTVSFTNGFQPAPGDSFEILKCSSRTGTFTNTTGLLAANGVVLLPSYTATNVVLIATTNIQILQPISFGTGFSFGFQTVNGVYYQVEYADSLNPPIGWQTLGTPIVGTGLFQTVTNTPLVSAQRFYRVRVQVQ